MLVTKKHGQIVGEATPSETKLFDISNSALIAVQKFSLVNQENEANNENEPRIRSKRIRKFYHKQRDTVQDFYIAIECSFRAANSGETFADSSEVLCDTLLKTGSRSLPEVDDYIGNLRQMAQEAYRHAHDIFDTFRALRVQFVQIYDDIPTLLVKMKDIRTKEIGAGKVEHCAKMLAVGTIVVGGAVTVGATLAGAAVFPPALLVIPVIIELFAVFTKLAASRVVSNTKKEGEICRQLIPQLEKLLGGRTQFFTGLNEIVDTWHALDLELEDMLEDTRRLNRSQWSEISLYLLKSRWNVLKDRYSRCMNEISGLQAVLEECKSSEVMRKCDERMAARANPSN